MTTASIAAWMATALVAGTMLPTVYVLGREAIRQRRTRAAVARIAEVTASATSPSGKPGAPQTSADLGEVASNLRQNYDELTVEKAVEELLSADEDVIRETGVKLFAELGLTARYSAILRNARRWSDRAHAAEILGLAGDPAGVPALVAVLNDRFEDGGSGLAGASVKTAATKALARLKDPTAIPLLIQELMTAPDTSARAIAETLVAFGGLAVAPLLKELDGPSDRAGRVWTARVLGRIADSRATDDLIARLHDRDDLMRIAAAEALGIIADARSIQPLIRATLRDPAPQVRAHAAAAVASVEGARAVDVLVSALADPDYGTRLRALEALEAIRVEDTSQLESALRDPNVEVRRRAALALERVGYLDRTIGQLTSTDRKTSDRAYASLSELASVGLLDSVVAYIHHESFEVRALVARVVGELGAARVAPLLRDRLRNDEAWPVRAAIATTLGRLKDTASATSLVELLTDPEEPVREAAADALTSLPESALLGKEHLDAITAAYDAGSVVVRAQMITLASRFTEDARADQLLVRASTDASDTVRLRAVTALGARLQSAPSDKTRDARVLPLVARLTDGSLDVRMAAVAALGGAASTEAFEGLLAALTGAAPALRDRIAESLSRGARQQLFVRLDELEKASSIDVRLGIAWTLGKCGDKAGVPALARFLRDQSPELRASAAGALAKIADQAARDALLTASEDPNGRVRAAVVNALGRAREEDARVIEVLERSLRDPDAFVRDRALVSLAFLSKAELAPRLEERATGASRAARLVAAALVGTDPCLAEVVDGMTVPGVSVEISKFLAHEDPAIRAAFFAAVHLEDPSAEGPPAAEVPVLVAQYEQLLRTSLEVETRRFAVRALGRLVAGRSVEILADALTVDPAEDVRSAAADALRARVDDEVARAALVRAVGDPSPEVAMRALHALEGRAEPEVASALARRLGAGTPEVQRTTEETLAEIHRADPTPFLDWMMGVDVVELLIPAVRVLERLGHPMTAPLLRELAKSRSASLRAAVVRALASLPTPDADAILAMVEDPSMEVRLAVVESTLWSPESLLRANVLKSDPSVEVRAALATSLGQRGGERHKPVFKVLGALLDDASPLVRARALASLMVLDTPGLMELLRRWPAASLEVQKSLTTDPRAPAIVERLAQTTRTATDPLVRQAAVTAMGSFGLPRTEVMLEPAIEDPSREVRMAAAQALAALEAPAARTLLAKMLSDPDVEVREAVRRSALRPVG